MEYQANSVRPIYRSGTDIINRASLRPHRGPVGMYVQYPQPPHQYEAPPGVRYRQTVMDGQGTPHQHMSRRVVSPQYHQQIEGVLPHQRHYHDMDTYSFAPSLSMNFTPVSGTRSLLPRGQANSFKVVRVSGQNMMPEGAVHNVSSSPYSSGRNAYPLMQARSLVPSHQVIHPPHLVQRPQFVHLPQAVHDSQRLTEKTKPSKVVSAQPHGVANCQTEHLETSSYKPMKEAAAKESGTELIKLRDWEGNVVGEMSKHLFLASVKKEMNGEYKFSLTDMIASGVVEHNDGISPNEVYYRNNRPNMSVATEQATAAQLAAVAHGMSVANNAAETNHVLKDGGSYGAYMYNSEAYKTVDVGKSPQPKTPQQGDLINRRPDADVHTLSYIPNANLINSSNDYQQPKQADSVFYSNPVGSMRYSDAVTHSKYAAKGAADPSTRKLVYAPGDEALFPQQYQTSQLSPGTENSKQLLQMQAGLPYAVDERYQQVRALKSVGQGSANLQNRSHASTPQGTTPQGSQPRRVAIPQHSMGAVYREGSTQNELLEVKRHPYEEQQFYRKQNHTAADQNMARYAYQRAPNDTESLPMLSRGKTIATPQQFVKKVENKSQPRDDEQERKMLMVGNTKYVDLMDSSTHHNEVGDSEGIQEKEDGVTADIIETSIQYMKQGECRPAYIEMYNPVTDKSSTREIKFLKVSSNPDVAFFYNLLTPVECKHLISLAEGRLQRSKTSKGGCNDLQDNYKSGESVNRTSFSAHIKPGETEIVSAIESRVCHLAGVDVSYLEPLVVIKYEPKQFFKEHHDGSFRRSTLLLYLNDVNTGGETHFPYLGFSVSPSEGAALYWRNNRPDGSIEEQLYHSALPSPEHVKWVVNCFFNFEKVRIYK